MAIDPKNQVMVAANPLAKRVEEGKARILNGFDKLLNTTEKECIALYEASLIRYFSPEFNTEFKNSFPSTNLKVLQDCYEKDFSGVIAEICIDQLPFRLCSDEIKPAINHIIKHDLHKNEDRRLFFGF